MSSWIKDIEVKDNGYIQLRLQRSKDFDEYMLYLLQQDADCLSCMTMKQEKNTFLYDVKGKISLSKFFSIWQFHGLDYAKFLLEIFTVLSKLEIDKPIVLESSYLYLDVCDLHIHVIVLPIHSHVNEDLSWYTFLQELISQVNIVEGYAILGFLLTMFKTEQVKGDQIVQALRNFIKQEERASSWLQKQKTKFRWKELHKRNEEGLAHFVRNQRLQEECAEKSQDSVQVSNNRSRKVVDANATVVLFEPVESSSVYVETKEGERFFVQEKGCNIGRSVDMDISLSSLAVSSHHGCLKMTQRGWCYQDNGSSNGSYLNGKKLVSKRNYRLHEYDELCVADIMLTFHQGES